MTLGKLTGSKNRLKLRAHGAVAGRELLPPIRLCFCLGLSVCPSAKLFKMLQMNCLRGRILRKSRPWQNKSLIQFLRLSGPGFMQMNKLVFTLFEILNTSRMNAMLYVRNAVIQSLHYSRESNCPGNQSVG